MIKHMDWYCLGPQVGLCREYMYIDKDDIKDNNLKVGAKHFRVEIKTNGQWVEDK